MRDRVGPRNAVFSAQNFINCNIICYNTVAFEEFMLFITCCKAQSTLTLSLLTFDTSTLSLLTFDILEAFAYTNSH